MKCGRHRVVRLQSGQRASRSRQLAKDEFEDEEGNLFRQYPIYDDVELVAPLPNIHIARVTQAGGSGGRGHRGRRRRHGPNSGRTKCGECGHLGHNKRTCPLRHVAGQEGTDAREARNPNSTEGTVLDETTHVDA